MDKLEEDKIVEDIEAKRIDVEADTPTKTQAPDTPPKRGLRMPVTRKGKAGLALALLLLLFVIICALPFTRYGLFGLFVSKDVELKVVDSASGKPVSGVAVAMGRYDATSDAKGLVKIENVPVGDYRIKAEKKYYETHDINYRVPIVMAPNIDSLKLRATGRTVTVLAKNRITGKPIVGANVTVSETTAISNEGGEAAVVLPAKSEPQKATVSRDGYNDLAVDIVVAAGDNQTVEANMTPAGKVFFLSRRTGKLNVMSSNLDGSDQQVILEGSGHEPVHETRLIPSSDWSRLALITNRDGQRMKLFVINTANNQIVTAQQDDASYEPIGWSGNSFYYKLYRNDLRTWQGKTQAIAAYDAAEGAVRILDETAGVGTGEYDFAAETISPAYMIGKVIGYAKSWNYSSYYADKSRPASIMKITTGVNARAVVRDLPGANIPYIDNLAFRPNQLVFRAAEGTAGAAKYYMFDGNKLTDLKSNDSEYYANRINYIMSPAGDKSLWADIRDGQGVMFTGDAGAGAARELSRGKFMPYGWVGEGYILYSRGGSELFITSVDGPVDGAHKISDYHSMMLSQQNQAPGGWGYGSY